MIPCNGLLFPRLRLGFPESIKILKLFRHGVLGVTVLLRSQAEDPIMKDFSSAWQERYDGG